MLNSMALNRTDARVFSLIKPPERGSCCVFISQIITLCIDERYIDIYTGVRKNRDI